MNESVGLWVALTGGVVSFLSPCVMPMLPAYLSLVSGLSLEEAVAKLTAKSADAYGLKDRGRIGEGAFADLVVFDPDTVTDRATYEDPHQTADGIELVVVNGQPILENGTPAVFDGPMPGRTLRYER